MKLSLIHRHVVVLAVAALVATSGTSLIAEDAETAGTTSETEASTTADSENAAAEEEVHPIANLLFPKKFNFNLPPVQPNLQMFLWTFILFAGYLFVMKKGAWGPLINAVNQREARVLNAERDAELARREVEKLRVESEARLAEVQEQVKAIIAEARSQAEAEKREIVAKAEQDAQRVKSEALRELEAAHQAAIQNLDQMVDEQVALATEHVVGRRL